MPRTDILLGLPAEVSIAKILQDMSVKQLLTMAVTCRGWHELCLQEANRRMGGLARWFVESCGVSPPPRPIAEGSCYACRKGRLCKWCAEERAWAAIAKLGAWARPPVDVDREWEESFRRENDEMLARTKAADPIRPRVHRFF
jgi:hypothetical protein